MLQFFSKKKQQKLGTCIVKETNKTEHHKENRQGHIEKPRLRDPSTSHATPSLTHMGLWISTSQLLCSCSTCGQPKADTLQKQLPPATLPNFPQLSSSAWTAGVTLVRGEKSTLTADAFVNTLMFSEMLWCFVLVLLLLRGFMQKRIRESYSSQQHDWRWWSTCMNKCCSNMNPDLWAWNVLKEQESSTRM